MKYETALKESIKKWTLILERTKRGVLIDPFEDEPPHHRKLFNRCALCDYQDDHGAMDCKGCVLNTGEPGDPCADYFEYDAGWKAGSQRMSVAAAESLLAKLLAEKERQEA
jgi:hypothetical protein